LGLLLAREELDIIEDEDIDLTIALTELIHRSSLDTRDIVSEELVSCCIDDTESLVLGTDSIGDSLEEMRLAEPDITIEVEWIV
jgi:hypothetical protein